MNIGNPGTFEIEMNKMLGRNNLPTMSFPANPASGSVLQASRLTNPDAPQETDNAEVKGAAEQHQPQQYTKQTKLTRQSHK
ncbi:hypothetical protein Hamer_G011784 [Homarus americanus]|uniref:Uncharacterized protein n=1 Tax=Homarus americanus TaxID=6706 RepID=A0A8J5JWZ7_HOMAM|nr:hypothetical protein Hamer_G011783 [Homarus americanus]KAG7165885.1 hypothetical protein Hamer_G011784 [Homarus americanus]